MRIHLSIPLLSSVDCACDKTTFRLSILEYADALTRRIASLETEDEPNSCCCTVEGIALRLTGSTHVNDDGDGRYEVNSARQSEHARPYVAVLAAVDAQEVRSHRHHQSRICLCRRASIESKQDAANQVPRRARPRCVRIDAVARVLASRDFLLIPLDANFNVLPLCCTGVFGYGRERPAWNFFPPYWPETQLQQLNPNHIIIDVGVASSDHDRACEIFYQLMGGTVDYGEEHAKHTTHARYGTVFAKALHPNWSETNPIHLVGHSLGALTALEFYQLVSADFFGVGSNHKWVRSITSIAGPLTGSTLTHMVGLHDTTMAKGSVAHLLYIAMALWGKMYIRVPFLKKAYDFRMDQWENHSFSQLAAVDGPINASMDSGFFSILPSRRVQLNAQLKHMDKLHLMSIVTSPKTCHVPMKEVSTLTAILVLFWGRFPRWWPALGKSKLFRGVAALLCCVSLWKQVKKLDAAKLPSLYGLKWLMRRTAKALPKIFDGYEAHHWEHNDGAVNIRSQLRPWFPKPQELSTTTSIDHMDPHTKTLPGTLPPPPPPPSSRANETDAPAGALPRCESHISISDFYKDVEEAEQEAEQQRQASQKFMKGRWYVYRVDSNHLTGTYWDREATNLYKSLFAQMINEYEVDHEDSSRGSGGADHYDAKRRAYSTEESSHLHSPPAAFA